MRNITIALILACANVASAQGDVWTTKADHPVMIALQGGGSVNGKVYMGGGMNAYYGTVYDSMWEFDPATNAWTARTPLPIPLAGMGSVTLNGKIYFIGGATSNSGWGTNAVLIYDPAADSWATGAPMPTARYGLVCGVANGKIYACGGVIPWEPDPTLAASTKAVEAYDPVTNTWTIQADMPVDLAFPAGNGLGGKMYVVGGFPYTDIVGASFLPGNEFSNVSRSTLEFDPATNTWTVKSPMPDDLLYGWYQGASAVIGDKLYCFGGEMIMINESAPPPTGNWEYTPATDTWAWRAALDNATWQSAWWAVGAGGKAYMTGGIYYDPSNPYNLGDPKNTLEYTPPAPVANVDLAVLSVTNALSAPAGSTVQLSAEVANQGTSAASFDVLFSVGTTIVGSATVSDLAAGASTTVAISWNTAGWSLAGYPITVSVPELIGESEPADNTAGGFIWITAMPSATLTGKMAWAEHKNYSLSGDENAFQTLFGKAKNSGTGPATVRVKFAVTKNGSPLTTVYSSTTTLLAGGTAAVISGNLDAAASGTGSYSVTAQVQVKVGTEWYDSGVTKTITFNINP